MWFIENLGVGATASAKTELLHRSAESSRISTRREGEEVSVSHRHIRLDDREHSPFPRE